MPSKTRKNPASDDMTREIHAKDRTTVIEPIMDGYHTKPDGSTGNTKYSRNKPNFIQVTPGKWVTK